MNKNQIYSIAIGSTMGTSIATIIGAVTVNIPLSLLFGSLIVTLIGVVLALIVFKDETKKD